MPSTRNQSAQAAMEPEESQTVAETVDPMEVDNQAEQTPIPIVNIPSTPSEEPYSQAALDSLRAKLEVKRRREAIEDAEKELNGEPFLGLNDIEGLPTRGKRAATSCGNESTPRYLRPSSPPTYSGKDLKEMENFAAGYRTYFDADLSGACDSDANRIRLAASSLKGKALLNWDNRTEEPETYNDFIDWCRNLVSDPENRKNHAFQRLKTIQQRERQSVRELATVIESLERDIPPLSQEEIKAWTLLNALKPETRREVLKENKTITSRDQVIAAAQRQEELARDESTAYKTQESSGRSRAQSSRGRNTRKNRTESVTPRRAVPDRSASRSGKCFNCGKPGHKAAECWSRKTEQAQSGSGAGSEHPKAKN
jgi:Zinc knuckle